jgi:acyl carrier protein
MQNDEILAKLTPIFRDVFDVDDIVLTLDMKADDVAEWDSLTHVRLVASIEKQFGVRFSAAEMDTLRDVGDLVTLLGKKAD